MDKYEKISVDKATQEMLRVCEKEGVETIFDRFEQQQPQCGYGSLGLCCTICAIGPCRIDPFGEEPKKGSCGASADLIVARNLCRTCAAGAAAQSAHARHMMECFKDAVEGDGPYEIKDEAKLKGVADKLGISTAGSPKKIAKKVLEKLFAEFGKMDNKPMALYEAYLNEKRLKLLKDLNLVPTSIDGEITEAMHRTTAGVDSDPFTLIHQGIRVSNAAMWGASHIATTCQDILFGTPDIIQGEANFGVLKEDEVNIIVHGHAPNVAEKVVEAASDPEMIKLAESVGAKGINIAGVCCTALEALQRHGVGLAGNFTQQELIVATGAIEAWVVDVQCIMPGIDAVADCYHTKVVDTIKSGNHPGAEHIMFDIINDVELGKKIVKLAVENFPNRVKERVHIPQHKSGVVSGFSNEAVVKALGGSLDPLLDAIKGGAIKGVLALAACNNPKIRHNYGHTALVDEAIKRDILCIGTGCWAHAAASSGMFLPEYAENAGEGLKSVCKALGIPPALHTGTCVDISRNVELADLIARALGVDISDLPVVASAPEWMNEKAVHIGAYLVAHGITTHLGVPPAVLGSPYVTEVLTKGAQDLLGAVFFVEPDPVKAAVAIDKIMMQKRKALGI